MSPVLVQRIVAVVLIGHGIGHGLGVLAGLGISLSDSHSLHSWVLSGLFGEKGATYIGIIVYLAAMACFTGTGLGLLHWLVPHGSWQTLATASVVLSLAGLALFWNAYPFFIPNKAGVLLVDTMVLLSVLKVHWPPQLY